MRARRLIAAGLVALVCAAVTATALAAPASGGRHLPFFSLLNERVAVKKLPLGLRLSGLVRGGLTAERTIAAAGTDHWVCESEESDREAGGGGSSCTTLAGARELDLLDVTSCGKGPARHFHVGGLVPDGVTGLELEKTDGTIGRTVPVLQNTVAFSDNRPGCSFYTFAVEP